MKNDVSIINGITIPEHELEITASRAGGPGGQHVNKTSSKITVRWNVKNTSALTDEQKERVMQKLESRLTIDGDLVISSSTSRSQHHNREAALNQLSKTIEKALRVPKKRMRTRIPQSIKEAHLQQKRQRSEIKKMRSKKINYE